MMIPRMALRRDRVVGISKVPLAVQAADAGGSGIEGGLGRHELDPIAIGRGGDIAKQRAHLIALRGKPAGERFDARRLLVHRMTAGLFERAASNALAGRGIFRHRLAQPVDFRELSSIECAGIVDRRAVFARAKHACAVVLFAPQPNWVGQRMPALPHRIGGVCRQADRYRAVWASGRGGKPGFLARPAG